MRLIKTNNQWISPDEIETIDGIKYLKKDKSKKITVGASESMSKSKRILLILKKLYQVMVLMLSDYLFCQIALQKRCTMV